MSYLLKPTKGSTHSKKRIGRGNASGQGRTAGKGHKGYKSRSGTKAKLHFEGGQTPLMRRLPKRGMKIFSKSRRYKKTYQIINLDMIVSLNVSKVDADVLYKKGIISNRDIPVKILSNGEIKDKIEFSFEMYSKTAINKIEKAGGIINYI